MENIIKIILILPFIFAIKPGKVNNNNKKKEVVFEFSKLTKFVMLFYVFLTLILLGLSIYSLINGEVNLYVVIIMLILFITMLLIAFYPFNKKIVFKDNIFYYTNLLKDNKTFKYADIVKAKYMRLDGIKIYFKDKKKLLINEQMNNFPLIKDKLDDDFLLK